MMIDHLGTLIVGTIVQRRQRDLPTQVEHLGRVIARLAIETRGGP